MRQWMRLLAGCVVVATSVLLESRTAHAQQGESEPPVCSADDLVRMNRCELEALYRRSRAAAISDGELKGTAIRRPGTRFASASSKAARVVWQGKIVDSADGTAVNRFFGVRSVRAEVSYGDSWMDGKPALILDYRQSSFVYRNVRDEIREVRPGLYLGVMYQETPCGPEFKRYFALETACE